MIVLDLRDGQLVPNTNFFETIAYYAKSRNLARSRLRAPSEARH